MMNTTGKKKSCRVKKGLLLLPLFAEKKELKRIWIGTSSTCDRICWWMYCWMWGEYRSTDTDRHDGGTEIEGCVSCFLCFIHTNVFYALYIIMFSMDYIHIY